MRLHRDMDIARLRGEAQGEQAVAWVRVRHNGFGMELARHVAYELPDGEHPLYTRPQAALSSTAAPAGNLVAWWNGIRPDTRSDDSSIRWGADAEDSGHDIPLYDGPNPIHATPAPVAGDAVAEREPLTGSEPRDLAFYLHWALDVMAEDPGLESYSMRVHAMHREAGYALAQYRASQAGAPDAEEPQP